MLGMGNLHTPMSAGLPQAPVGLMGMATPVIPQSQGTQMSQPPLVIQNEPLAPSKPPKSSLNGIQV